MSARRLIALGTLFVAILGAVVARPASAQVQMPDPSMIHGKALPAGDLQTGPITVRVVREAADASSSLIRRGSSGWGRG